MKLTTIKIQDSAAGFLKGRLAEMGLDEEILSCPRVSLSDAECKVINGKILEALEGVFEQIETLVSSVKDAEEAAKVADSLRDNVLSFRLDAGTGYTNIHKKALCAMYEAEGITMDTFTPPKGGKGTAKKDEMSLDLVL